MYRKFMNLSTWNLILISFWVILIGDYIWYSHINIDKTLHGLKNHIWMTIFLFACIFIISWSKYSRLIILAARVMFSIYQKPSCGYLKGSCGGLPSSWYGSSSFGISWIRLMIAPRLSGGRKLRSRWALGLFF